MEPINIRPIAQSTPIVQRTMSLSGTPLPEDLRDIIIRHFEIDDNNDALDIVYQYILHKSPSAEIDDIKSTIEALASKLAPNKQELFNKIRDLAINEINFADSSKMIEAKRDILNKELPGLERQAQETGDWRFYLRASQRRDELGSPGDIEG